MLSNMPKVVVLIWLFLINISMVYGLEKVLVVIDGQYDKNRGFQQIIELGRSLKDGTELIVYSGTHSKITTFKILSSIYSRKIWNRKYKNQRIRLANYIKNNNQSMDFQSHIEFLVQKQKILLTKTNINKCEGIVLSDMIDSNLEKISSEYPELKLGDLSYIRQSPLYVNNNEYNKAVIHILYSRERKDIKKYCRMWERNIEKGGGILASCQSNEIYDYILQDKYKPKHEKISEEYILGNLIDKLENIFKLANWSYIPPKQQSSSIIINNHCDHNNCKCKYNKVIKGKFENKSKISKRHKFPLILTLTWKGTADMDLSIYSAEGKLFFGSKSKYGNFYKDGKNTEIIELFTMPKDANLRVVHSDGTEPKALKLNISDKDGTFSHDLKLYGSLINKSSYKSKEQFFLLPLEDIMTKKQIRGNVIDKIKY